MGSQQAKSVADANGPDGPPPNDKRLPLEQLVSVAIEKRVVLDPFSRGPEKYTVLEISKTPDDSLRPLKTVATDLVVNEFFTSEETLFRFLNRVYTTFHDALEIYRSQRGGIRDNQLFFLYKGGNILRIISREFLLGKRNERFVKSLTFLSTKSYQPARQGKLATTTRSFSSVETRIIPSLSIPLLKTTMKFTTRLQCWPIWSKTSCEVGSMNT